MISILTLKGKVIAFRSASNASELNYTSNASQMEYYSWWEMGKQIKYLESLYNIDHSKMFT